ncbi:SWIM zinc finger family protein [Dactylosporangium sp. CS-033363]|uniref:SWIM zinc finger family protein n=1 Tax=Dactylosporangium sp. CS-033363 TaxID=3239935 RepID=UPI003D916549
MSIQNLTPESLAALTNRGLVKRAAREVEAAPPALTEDPDGTIRATFADGAAPVLPTGGLEKATCTCGAAGVCRHIVGLILAYQRQAESPKRQEVWSPGAFTDEQLEERIGARMMAAARRARKAGYHARVYRPTAQDHTARADLGSATVRFLVPDDLGFVHTDAVAGTRDDVIALAAWAFRAADEQAPGEPDAQVDVGETKSRETQGEQQAVELADEILQVGAVNLGQGIKARIAHTRKLLERENLRWPLLAVEELQGQLDAYRERASAYTPERLAELIAELHARAQAAGTQNRGRVLGTEEAAETPLRRARLDGLGCSVTEDGGKKVYLAHADSATVLVLRTTNTRTAQGLGGGIVVTESAVRSASRAVRLTTSRVAKATITPSRGAWDALPDALLVRDLAALAAELDRLPPRMLRPRVEAELVRVIKVAAVREITYAPGAQQLEAVLVDEHGNEATLIATHTAAAPGRLDAIAANLTAPSYVSGVVRRRGGAVELDPLAIAAGGRVVLPDLAEARGGELGPRRPDRADPIRAALDHALATLAEVPHRGMRHLPPTFGDRLRTARDRLIGVGLYKAAEAVHKFGETNRQEAWVEAHIRLSVTAETQ